MPILPLAAFTIFALPSSAELIPLDTGTPAQSSQVGGFAAGNALDDVSNFTHTQGTDDNPTWQVLLPETYAFGVIEAFNRAASGGVLDCCPSRLRDITIQVLEFNGDVTTDFTGGTVVFESDLLNAENVVGGGTDSSGPVSLTADAGGARGNMIRIIRTPDPDLSGTGGLGNADEAAVLSLDLVTADGLVKSLELAPVRVDTEGKHIVPSSTVIGEAVGTLTFISGVEQDATFTFVAGEGDSDNSLYSIGGPDNDQILVNTDLSAVDGVAHSVRILATAVGEDPLEGAFAFTITGDSDDDGLPDSWEVMFGVLGDFSTGGNADGDGLTDEQEFAEGTDPSKADSDDDNVDDDVELADGTNPLNPDSDEDGLDDGAEKTAGSNPALADTDNDGLTDGDEVNIHGSNPVLVDSDNDTFDDALEVARGSDPADRNSVPIFGALVPLSSGIVAQSSQLGGFAAENALDEIVNFTHTANSDDNPTWQVLLPETYSFEVLEIFNRQASDGALGCCPSRLRDITVEIVEFEGDVFTDFTGGTVVYSSELLNPENVLGGGTASGGPVSLIVDAGGAAGNMLRIRRTPDPDLSGSDGAGNADEGSVLSIDLVTAEGSIGGGTPLAITEMSYDAATQRITLSWSSKKNHTYGVFFGYDLIDFDADVDDSIPSMGETTTFTFSNPEPNTSKLFFHVIETRPGG